MRSMRGNTKSKTFFGGELKVSGIFSFNGNSLALIYGQVSKPKRAGEAPQRSFVVLPSTS